MAMPAHKKREAAEILFEMARERDLYRYYQPSSPPHFAPDHVPRSSYDTALSAFAQLATLRSNTRRALISLIDRTNEYILAEATQTLSLQSGLVYNDQNDIWFGCSTLPRSQGLCEKALETLPSSKLQRLLPLVINDLTQDDKFKDRSFVTSRLSLRFYAAMPIITKAGFNIGSLCVMDDKPRDGLSDVEIGFLGDMAITIMAHLEIGRVKEEHRRSKKMVKGLGLFVEGASTLHEWWLLDVRNDRALRQTGSNGREAPAVARAEPAGELRPLLAPQMDCNKTSIALNIGDQNTLAFPTPESSSTPAREPDESPIQSTGDDQHSANPSQSFRTSTADLQEIMLPENLKEMFSRAGNIIRECIEVDGAIFLDASIGTFRGHIGESHTILNQLEIIEGRSQGSAISSSEEEYWGGGNNEAEGSRVSLNGSYESQMSRKPLTHGVKEKEKMCGILGFSTAEKCSLRGDKAPENYVPIEEAFLYRLLYRYPRGQVFNLGRDGPVISIPSDT